MKTRIGVVGVLVIAWLALTTVGCTKSDTEAAKPAGTGTNASANAGGGGGASSASSGIEEQARAAALTEAQRHWVKAPEGWITARVSGSPYAPDRYLRQLRDITVAGVESFDLGESDKMNGFEWAGQVTFRSAPCREAGDPGLLLEGMSNLGISVNRQRGRWTQWVDYQPEPVRLQKVKGKWQMSQDQWLLRGNAPTPQDYANARVR